ncbi:ParA family partition ATPase (plasmid) [Robbsia andropogonis]|uniref:ParA family partition ATPase n=1 Tax=Robbsia andropogonis TaxID=28092 RepID=UPI0020A14BB1|nr:ParA family partition ATPase [Robbsia andropogonis]MCP1120989.1 ParA family protein [Robbsia andropogonis]MCP1130830.1 ParA family protein [Robbsia andropogonis]
MGLVIAVANQKGGVGKTTTTMNLAGAFHEQGYKTVVADADAQNSCLRWSAVANEDQPLPFSIVSIAGHGKQIGNAAVKLAEDAEIVLVDCPPSIETPTTARILLVADATIIPTDSSPLDLWSSEGMMQLVERTRALQPEGKYALLLNRSNVKTTLHKEMKELLSESDVRLFKSTIKQRIAYQLSAVLGRTVFDAKGIRSLKEAQEEVRSLFSELLLLLEEK